MLKTSTPQYELSTAAANIVRLLGDPEPSYLDIAAEAKDIQHLCMREHLIRDGNPNPTEAARLRKKLILEDDDIAWLMELAALRRSENVKA